MPKRKHDSQTPETQPEAVATVSMEEFETLKKMLEESQAKEQEYRDGWQRSVADFANYRKRTERDNEQLGKMVTGNTIKKFLGVMDDLERALANRPADDAWANGIELVYRKFQGILESENITRIPAEGQPFDPTFHEAIMQEPSDSHESGMVTAVLQQGYMHGERVLRPALVKVTNKIQVSGVKRRVSGKPDTWNLVPEHSRMSKIIGIDLGTTNSVVAVMMGSEPVVIPSAEGERLVPSVVAINKNGERLVGRVARNQAIVNAQNTIFSVKRFMGRKFDDSMVQRTQERVPYRVSAAENGDVRVVMAEKDYAPPEVSAMILTKMKADAEAYLGQPVTKAVITVPAYFNDAQRNATKDAGKIAGLEVLRIINEPTASSLAYGLDKKNDEIICVYDLGGGTFDVSILEVSEGVIEVKATSGDTFLGGDDFDQRIMDYLIQEFQRENRLDLRKDKQALQRLKEASEKAKIELSTVMQTEINLPYLTADSSGPKHLVQTLTRAKLEQFTADLVERTLGPVRQALQDAGLAPAKINEVVLVGGMTRMPAIQESVRRMFGKDPHKGVNPDEVVAIGAAIQGGVLAGDVTDILLLDVTPLTLSIETLGGVSTPLIERNTTIPTRKGQAFSTATDNQTQVEIHVVQGERPLVADNKSLGRFILDGIPPAPRGMPQVEVTFDIDVNGILKVTASDKATGRTQHITLTASSGLSPDEVERMRQEAESHTDEDRKRREDIDIRNQADSTVYAAEKAFSDFGAQASEEAKADLEKNLTGLKDALNQDDTIVIRAWTESLSQATLRFSSSLHDSNPPESGSPFNDPDAKTRPF